MPPFQRCPITCSTSQYVLSAPGQGTACSSASSSTSASCTSSSTLSAFLPAFLPAFFDCFISRTLSSMFCPNRRAFGFSVTLPIPSTGMRSFHLYNTLEMELGSSLDGPWLRNSTLKDGAEAGPLSSTTASVPHAISRPSGLGFLLALRLAYGM